MPASHLKMAKQSEIHVIGKGEGTRAERIRHMQETARALAKEEVVDMLKAIAGVAEMAESIANGGEAYAVGIRELSGRLHADLTNQSKSIEALLHRS